ncbi:MAG TPA: hypothetical protein VK801_04320 [Caulobacteraceae bacterium]|jgi:hypothetical protein|nr:hypothetical protein [Caulobacteraceae bacterium]
MRALVATQPRSLAVVPAWRDRPVSVSLWLPLTPLLILLAPLVLILTPFVACSRRARAVGSLRMLGAIGAILTSLSGTRIEVDTPRARVRLRIF